MTTATDEIQGEEINSMGSMKITLLCDEAEDNRLCKLVCSNHVIM